MRQRAHALRAWPLFAVLVLAHCKVVELAEALPPPPGELVDVGGGRRIHIDCAGRGSPTVLLEAGGTHDSTQFSRVQPELAELTRVCSYDRAGMGWSDPSPVPRSTRAIVDDLTALLEARDIGPPWILVGGSAGGLTVDLFAREHPDGVAGVVLLDAASEELIARTRDTSERTEWRACTGRALAHAGVLRFLDPLDRRTEHREDNPELAVDLTYRRAPWDAICSLVEERETSFAQIRAAPPFPASIPLVVIARDPTLASQPDEDGLQETEWHAIQQHVAARSASGRVVVAEGSGHHIVTDRPDLVIETVRALVLSERLSPTAKRR